MAYIFPLGFQKTGFAFFFQGEFLQFIPWKFTVQLNPITKVFYQRMDNTALPSEHILWETNISTNFLERRSVWRKDELQAIRKAFQAGDPSKQRCGVLEYDSDLPHSSTDLWSQILTHPPPSLPMSLGTQVQPH